MKPFNLAEALDGAFLITRNGEHNYLEIIKHNPDIHSIKVKSCIIKNSDIKNCKRSIYHYGNDGKSAQYGFDYDLFMQEYSDLEEKFTDNSLIITCEKCFNANQNLLYKIQRMEEEIKSLNKKIQQIKIIGENLISVCSKEYMP